MNSVVNLTKTVFSLRPIEENIEIKRAGRPTTDLSTINQSVKSVPFYVVAFYTYYHGIMDHSGIDFKAPWWQPWRPDTMHHDNHHQYFHVNFGFNVKYWDVIHGTIRQPDRIYREHIYYGKGKALADATEQEIQEELDERSGENPNAHRDNIGYLLKEEVRQKAQSKRQNIH